MKFYVHWVYCQTLYPLVFSDIGDCFRHDVDPVLHQDILPYFLFIRPYEGIKVHRSVTGVGRIYHGSSPWINIQVNVCGQFGS